MRASLEFKGATEACTLSGLFVGALLLIAFLSVAFGSDSLAAFHIIYSGVFDRWYYQRDEERPLAGAIAAGLGPALGSCARGGLIITLDRPLEQVAKQAQRESQRGGNMVMCVIFCWISSCIDCIGDMIEYFNKWVFVQVALRGVRFFPTPCASPSRC